MASSIDLEEALAALDVPPRRYALYAALVVAASIGVAVGLPLLVPEVFTGIFVVLPYAVPLMTAAALGLFPFSLAQRNRHVIDHSMHYFITHLGVLATSDVPRVELFEIIGDREGEYGPLAEECRKIANLVTNWNMSLASACRFVAQRTPSELFGDFLERFAFGIESGAELESFLEAEQEVVMADYESLYERTLANVDRLDSLYNGLMMTSIFLVIFGMTLPLLVGGSSGKILMLIVLAIVVLQVAFVVVLNATVPPDPVWADLGEESPLWERIELPLPMAIAASAALAVVLLTYPIVPIHLAIPVAASPTVIPGLLARLEEGRVKRRDDAYPAFVRSLGTSAAARGGDEREVLRNLRHHDFGPLTDNIRSLFSRLQLRIDDEASWSYFTTEAGSQLVERFTSMYDEAVAAGGQPDVIGRIISDNMVNIVGLRKRRYQKAGSFRGTLFGIAAAMAFALFVGVGILGMLTELFQGLSSVGSGPIDVPTIIHTSAANVPQLELLVVGLLVGNAAISSLMVRLIDGGARLRAFEDFPLLLWVSFLVALIASRVLSGLTDVAFG